MGPDEEETPTDSEEPPNKRRRKAEYSDDDFALWMDEKYDLPSDEVQRYVENTSTGVP